tara:strand:+ start:185 stop:1054 length:870 start_codon:yes stop_codon:yes gene_type:complete
MFDLYLDRNKKDITINETLQALKIFIKRNKNNTIQEYGKIIKKNKIAILWGLKSKFKKDTNFRDIVKKKYENCIIVEMGFIKRDIFRCISWNEQANLSNPKPKNCPNYRFNKLKINVKPININKNGYILFCGQVPWDRQVQFLNTNYETWVIKTLHQIRKTTNRKILFRFHPHYLKHIKKKGKKLMNLQNFVNIDQNKSILDSIKNAYVTVSYNSTALIDSIINGCPILALHQMSPVYELSTKKVENIENLYIPSEEEVLQNLYNISYMQWNLDEIKNGEPFNYLLSLI